MYKKIEEKNLPPITRSVLELGKNCPPLPPDWDYKEEMTQILLEKYGITEDELKTACNTDVKGYTDVEKALHELKK